MSYQDTFVQTLTAQVFHGGGSRGQLMVWFDQDVLTKDQIWWALNMMHKEEFERLQDASLDGVAIRAKKWHKWCQDAEYDVPAEGMEQLTIFVKKERGGTYRVRPGAVSRRLEFRKMIRTGRLQEHPTHPDFVIWEGTSYRIPKSHSEWLRSPWAQEAMTADLRVKAVYQKNNRTTGERLYGKKVKHTRLRPVRDHFIAHFVEGVAHALTRTLLVTRRR